MKMLLTLFLLYLSYIFVFTLANCLLLFYFYFLFIFLLYIFYLPICYYFQAFAYVLHRYWQFWGPPIISFIIAVLLSIGVNGCQIDCIELSQCSRKVYQLYNYFNSILVYSTISALKTKSIVLKNIKCIYFNDNERSIVFNQGQ